jgi:hypothetical protein
MSPIGCVDGGYTCPGTHPRSEEVVRMDEQQGAQHARPDMRQRAMLDVVGIVLAAAAAAALLIYAARGGDGKETAFATGMVIAFAGGFLVLDFVLSLRALRRPEHEPVTGSRNWERPGEQV